MEIVINDEGVNRYGFRVLSKGIDLKAFRKNPVLLFNHQRSYEHHQKPLLPLGRWDNIRLTESGQLVAEPVLDSEDEVGVALKLKLENGFINAASLGMRIIEWSEDPKLMLPGQTLPTVTKCELQEISLVDIPANANCVRLSYNGDSVVCGDTDNGGDNKKKLSQIFKLQKKMDKETLKLLGLAENATDEEIKTAIAAMKSDSEKGAQVLSAEKEKQATLLVQTAVASGKITAAQEATFMKLALADYDSTKTALDAMESYVSISEKVKGAAAGKEVALGTEKPELVAKYDLMASNGTLLAFSRTDNEAFKKMQEAKVAYERLALKSRGLLKEA